MQRPQRRVGPRIERLEQRRAKPRPFDLRLDQELAASKKAPNARRGAFGATKDRTHPRQESISQFQVCLDFKIRGVPFRTAPGFSTGKVQRGTETSRGFRRGHNLPENHRLLPRLCANVKSEELHACHRVGQRQGEAENKPDQRNAQQIAVVSVIGHPEVS
jgi:hypothetical protein